MSQDEPRRNGFDLLDPASCTSLSADERERIVHEVLARGPLLIRRARQVQIAQRTALAGCVAAAAALVVMNLPQKPEPTAPAVAVAPSRGCEASPTNDQPTFTFDASGRGHLALGERASVVTEPGASMSIRSSTSCETLLALNSGEATVHARDLLGGTLQVETPYGDVHVKSTLFRVSVLASSAVIGVADGEVSVMREARPLSRVTKNQSLKVDNRGGISTSALSAEEADTMRSALNVLQEAHQAEAAIDVESPRLRHTGLKRPKRPSLKTETGDIGEVTSSANKLAEAEALWRAGKIQEARALFREAARDPGPTGEAAWVRLSRLELSRRDATAALTALRQRAQRTGGGVLQAEAMWLEVQALEMSGQKVNAEARANDLIRSFGSSPQAIAARRYLQER